MYLDFSESFVLVINQVYSSAHLKFHLVAAIVVNIGFVQLSLTKVSIYFRMTLLKSLLSRCIRRVAALGWRKLHFPKSVQDVVYILLQIDYNRVGFLRG